MLDPNRLICYCNDLTISDIVTLIKEQNIESLEGLIEQNEEPIGDKCEACHEEGYENDGFSLAMILSLVKQKRL